MATIERPGVEKLTVSDCPCCGSEVKASECGYSSFNPGTAKCAGCKREWALGNVDDQWDAGKTWNKLAAGIRKNLQLLSMVKVVQTNSISRDFHEEDMADEARELLKQFEESVIGAKKSR